MKFKFSYAVIPGTILFLFAGVALYLRVYLPYEQVFSDGLIRYIVWFSIPTRFTLMVSRYGGLRSMIGYLLALSGASP